MTYVFVGEPTTQVVVWTCLTDGSWLYVCNNDAFGVNGADYWMGDFEFDGTPGSIARESNWTRVE